MAPREEDSVDRHVARWTWLIDEPHAQLVEAAAERVHTIFKHTARRHVATFVGEPITHEDYQTLHAMLVAPYPQETTPAVLAEQLRVTRAAMTSRLDRLDERGYVTREVDPRDRRRVLVRPTAAGRAIWEEYLARGFQTEREVWSALTPEEMEQVNALLRKVVRSLDGE